MTTNRKKISLTDKLKILNELASGEKVVTISKRKSVNEATIRTIKKNEKSIRDLAAVNSTISRDNSYYVRNILLAKTERALAVWLVEYMQKGISVDSIMIKKKALQFYENMQSEPSTSTQKTNIPFAASNSWLKQFLERHSFHNVKISGESASADEFAANEFPAKLLEAVVTGGYKPCQVFNADETGLVWKKMPSRSYVSKQEKNVRGFKASKERVTLLLCSNASGEKLLKPLLVSKNLKPRALKGQNMKELPVHWMANKKAWVTASLFQDWFENCFVPEVEKYLIENKLENKALLLIDNAPGHPNIEHPNVKVMFLPPNTTSLIQPLDQGIISAFKRYYIKHSFKCLLDQMEADNEDNVTNAWKKFNIKNCIDCINRAVNEIKKPTLKNCWKKIWPGIMEASYDENNLEDYADIFEIARNIGGEGFGDMAIQDLNELFDDEVMADDDILEAINTSPNNNIEEIQDEDECVLTPMNTNFIKKGLDMAMDLEKHFYDNDPNSERAEKFQRDIQKAMQSYKILYEEKQKNCKQTTISTFFKKD